MSKFCYLKKERAKQLPESPGVYSFGGRRGFLYIGKAANLRARVKNHFAKPAWQDNHFVDQTTHVGYIKTASEIEALLLESQLIKKYQPRYNIRLRDDKQYFYIGFSMDKLPRLIITHQPKDEAKYLGPFTDGMSLKTVLRYLRKPFPYYTRPSTRFARSGQVAHPSTRFARSGQVAHPSTRFARSGQAAHPSTRFARSGQAAHRKLPCSYCHIGLCPGPAPNIKEYKKNIAKIKNILNGKKPRVITSLKKEMANFSKNFEFEKAAKARDQIAALENIFAHKLPPPGPLLRKPARQSCRLATAGGEGEKTSSTISSQLSVVSCQWSSLEACDISNIQGKEPAASMVRFDNGKPNKSMYRKFRIRLPEKPNDVAMIREAVRRRLKHREWPYPNIFLIDGGRGQLNAALREIGKMPFDSFDKAQDKSAQGEQETRYRIYVVALAKRFNELYFPGRKFPIPLSELPRETKNLLMHARDEAHRFAISYHRKLHRQTFQ